MLRRNQDIKSKLIKHSRNIANQCLTHKNFFRRNLPVISDHAIIMTKYRKYHEQNRDANKAEIAGQNLKRSFIIMLTQQSTTQISRPTNHGACLFSKHHPFSRRITASFSPWLSLCVTCYVFHVSQSSSQNTVMFSVMRLLGHTGFFFYF